MRDYRLSGPNNQIAQEKGLVTTEWYKTPIPRNRIKELIKRKDGPAIRDTLIWFGSIIVTAVIAYLVWETYSPWWTIPVFAIYGVLYAAAGSRWHECGHGTAFKTLWLNELVYKIASFMMLRPITVSRWQHQRHHSDTYIVGRDPEMIPRPTFLRILCLSFINVYGPPNQLKRLFMNVFGKLHPEEINVVPVSEYRKVFWEARIYFFILLSVLAWSFYRGDIFPILLIGTPLFYGIWLAMLYQWPEHAGLHEDVLDHRLNARTYYTNPIIRFLYWNMNYHIEHHMYPTVPYHALKHLHEEIKHDCPAPNRSLWATIKEYVQAFRKQQTDPNYVIERPLPSTANPCYYGPSPYLIQSQQSKQ
jgi:fatty acid desaturase